MSASLRSGLTWAADTDADAALAHLVDLPDVGPSVVRRMVAADASGESALARAVYAGRPGHPVLVGRSHWQPAVESATGDHGAGYYLASAGCREVPCEDLASGNDQDAAGA